MANLSAEWLVHNSQLSVYRSPFGAVSCNTEVALTLAVGPERAAEAVFLRVWRDGQGEELKPMFPVGRQDGRLLYGATLTAPGAPGLVWYYFVVDSGGERYFYGNNAGEKGGLGAISAAPPPSYQVTVFLPQAATPEWFKHAVVYQIFVDRFFNGNPDGKVAGAKPGSLIHACWDDDPVYVRERESGRILAYDFFGGNLAGVIAKLPYLKELGIGAIYFNPVFESISNHKYDTADYTRIDPLFGDNDLFERLCAQAAALGIAVILDGVFSHTGSDSIYFNREGRYPGPGAYQSAESPYYRWYRFREHPDDYECWWGVDALPNVNELEPSYREFIIHGEDSVIRRWLRLGAKGWRLDVADELPDQFIRELRQAMKQTDKDSVLIGEVWEDASRKVSYGELRGYLYGDGLDSPTNYPFRRIALDFLLHRQDAAATQADLMSLCENYPAHNFYAALNLVGSHDVPRILTLLGGHEAQSELPYGQQLKRRLTAEERRLAVARLKLLTLWQMTFPGVPHIYYGDEAGLEGYADPLNRRTYPWGREEAGLTDWYRKVIALRNRYDFLRTGRWLPLACHADVCGFVRFTEQERDVFGRPQDNNCAVVLLNRSSQAVTVEVDVSRWCRGMLFDVLADESELAAGDGRFRLELAPLAGRVLLARLDGRGGKCGVLLHPTGLPSPDGIGGLGTEARQFVDFLAAARQDYWQILPLNPVGFGYSPYQSASAFAGETLLIDIDTLAAEGLLTTAEAAAARERSGISGLPADRVDFTVVADYKQQLFGAAFKRFVAAGTPEDYAAFLQANRHWLPDYALYMALAEHFGDSAWNLWPEDIANRREEALRHYSALLADRIDYICFLQYVFYRQWGALRRYAGEQGVAIIGDLPIFVAHHSADVWANRWLFELDGAGRPTAVAGVPPDYFSKTGQLWGNPLYQWAEMAKDDYRWWRERLARLLELVDVVRIDHFRGFVEYWAVPADAETAERGRWVKGPGKSFFSVLERYCGKLPVIAEDLGIITPAVTALRQELGYPGMTVLQFAFPEGCGAEDRPLGCRRDAVVYTGTHDNNTALGWYRARQAAGETGGIDRYLAVDSRAEGGEVVWRLIELAYQCNAGTVIIPLQDILALDETARMNTPGTVGGNWEWRCPPDGLRPELAGRLAALAARHRRGR